MQLSLGPKPELDARKIDDLLELDTSRLHLIICISAAVTVSQIN